MSALLIALGPILALIVLGFVLRRSGFLPAGAWPGLERLTYYVLFPCLLVTALAEGGFADAAWPAILGVVVGVLTGAAGALLLYQWRVRPLPGPTFTSLFQGGVRFNTYIALALIQALVGDAGVHVAAVAFAFLIVLVNIACVTVLGIWGEGRQRGLLPLLREILLNPLIAACVIGGILGASESVLPVVVGDTLAILGSAALPLGLLAVGAALRPEEVAGHLRPAFFASLVQFGLKPLLAVILCALLGLDGIASSALIIIFMTPTAPASCILARQLGGDTETMASIVTLQTAMAFALMPLIAWIALDVSL